MKMKCSFGDGEVKLEEFENTINKEIGRAGQSPSSCESTGGQSFKSEMQSGPGS